MNLFLIGNGFDLNEGLPTSYRDFYEYVKAYNNLLFENMKFFYRSVFNKCDDNCQIIDLDRSNLIIDGDGALYPDDEYLWGALERNIANVSYSSIIHEFGFGKFPIDNTEKIIDELKVLFEETIVQFKDELFNWISSINSNSIFNKKFIDENDFINFNYTHTLEDRYSVESKNICYIHGSVKEKKLVFGCSNHDIKEFKKYRLEYIANSALAKALEKLLVSNEKPTSFLLKSRLEPFIVNKNYDAIIILGLSFSKVDIPYLEYLRQQYPKCKWIVSYFSETDKDRIKTFLNNNGMQYVLINDIDSFLSSFVIDE